MSGLFVNIRVKMTENYNIELKDFLNFLSIASKISIKENSDDIQNLDVDLNLLISNALIIKLFEYFQNTINKFGNKRDESEHAYSLPEEKNLEPTTMCRSKSMNNLNLNDFSELIENVDMNIVENENVNKIIHVVQNKLFEVLNEGIFDSVLSYLTQSTPALTRNKPGQNICENKSNATKKKKERKKKNCVSKHSYNNESEVEIHVYDEVKGCKKDFKCSPSLLVSNMGYFSEITKGQKLEEMDISVHCDITIFEWLMKWIKKDVDTDFSDLPKLDYKNVIPVMVSSNFLQMKLLFHDCLIFCKTNMNDVIRFSPNLTSLGDHVLKKLADIFSNAEIQNLKDKKDKIKSRLFCKLIVSLSDEEPEKHRGHFGSSAYLYFCFNCGKLVTRVSAPYVPCQLQYITLNYNRDVIFNHARDPNWNIEDHINNIWIECKNWSNTYWRLWSQSHFLYCYICRTMYAVAFADCCPYHPQQPHFYSIEQFQTTSCSIGRYPCCGSKAIRYETITIRSGCKLRSHTPKLQTIDDASIQTLIDSFPELIKIKNTDENVSAFVDNYDIDIFDGIYKNRLVEKEKVANGLLKGPLYEACLKTIRKNKSFATWERSNEYNNVNKYEELNENDCSIGESENSDISLVHDVPSNEQGSTSQCATAPIKPTRNENKILWSDKYSIRHNQDNQRYYEEIAFQAMSEVLLQKKEHENRKIIATENNYNYGGSFTKIESEWKEMLRTKSCSSNNQKKVKI